MPVRKGGRGAGLSTPGFRRVSHARLRRAAADLEGFAHSAAAMGRGQQEQGQTHTMMNAESDCDDAVL